MKRVFDIMFAMFGLIMFSPIMAVIAGLVRMSLGSPVIFSQERPGLLGKPFTLYKFRTMNQALDPNGTPIPDEERLTWFGRLLRSTSLDELPELWNVLKGDMSLVGPRPLLMEYLPLYKPEQMRRHEIRPGITGLAQINGRNTVSWEQRFDLDIWYVDHHSFFLDLKIIALTIVKVFTAEGISQPGHSTRSKYKGDQP